MYIHICLVYADVPGMVNHSLVEHELINLAQVLLTWPRAEPNNSPITMYRVTWCVVSSREEMCAEESTSMQLIPGTPVEGREDFLDSVIKISVVDSMIRVMIVAINDIGMGPEPSEAFFFDTFTASEWRREGRKDGREGGREGGRRERER